MKGRFDPRARIGPATLDRDSQPFRLRFRVVVTVIPLVVGIAVAVPLWDSRAQPEMREDESKGDPL